MSAVELYWCKTEQGRIVENVTSAFEGHRGHVLCVAVPRPPTAAERYLAARLADPEYRAAYEAALDEPGEY